MSFRRRHRWFRRMALGLALASVVFAGRVSVAAAKLDEGTGAAATAAIADPYLTDIFVRPGESLGGPDGSATAPAGAVVARPDDRAVRFVHSDVSPQPQPVSADGGSTFDWSNAFRLGAGAIVLALGLGLALGYLRRPKLAGL